MLTHPLVAPRPKFGPRPCQSKKPVGTQSTPKSQSCQIEAPCRSKSPASPTLSNDPMPRYAPFAIRQNPAKNRSKYQNGTRESCAIIQRIKGATTPNNGPAQTTSSGCGLIDRSVREMVSGCKTTLATLPPVSQVPSTCPDSCTAIMANQD